MLFVKPYVTLDKNLDDINQFCKFARQMATMVEFTNEREAIKIKKTINSYIREGRDIDEDVIAYNHDIDVNLIRLWKLVESIKLDMFSFINVDDDEIECYIQEEMCGHEGYVISNKYGTYKLVHRDMFSHYNFILEKKW